MGRIHHLLADTEYMRHRDPLMLHHTRNLAISQNLLWASREEHMHHGVHRAQADGLYSCLARFPPVRLGGGGPRQTQMPGPVGPWRGLRAPGPPSPGSAAGSVIRTPPATLTKTSQADRGIPTRFSRTANRIATRLRSAPGTTPRGELAWVGAIRA